jgi:hypothetical protein
LTVRLQRAVGDEHQADELADAVLAEVARGGIPLEPYDRAVGSEVATKAVIQQGSSATGTETSRLRRTSMDGTTSLRAEFSNAGSTRLQDGMQKVTPSDLRICVVL